MSAREWSGKLKGVGLGEELDPWLGIGQGVPLRVSNPDPV